jgi:anti-anti-sigma factor
LHVFSDVDISSGPAFEVALADAFAIGKKTVVDLTECPYIDTTGLRYLVRARNVLGDKLEIRAAQGSSPARILEVCGLDRALCVVFVPAQARPA